MSTDVGVQVSSSAPRRRGLRIVRDGVFFFKETPSLILSVAPPFKIESASLLLRGTGRPQFKSQNAAFVHGQGRRFFDEIFRLRRMNCALRTKGDSPARHTCSFCNSGLSFAHFSSAVSGFFSFYGGLFCRFSLTRVFYHIILKVRFRTLR